MRGGGINIEKWYTFNREKEGNIESSGCDLEGQKKNQYDREGRARAIYIRKGRKGPAELNDSSALPSPF